MQPEKSLIAFFALTIVLLVPQAQAQLASFEPAYTSNQNATLSAICPTGADNNYNYSVMARFYNNGVLNKTAIVENFVKVNNIFMYVGGENFRTAIIDNTKGFAYFGTYTSRVK
jgi:hypothetical protein